MNAIHRIPRGEPAVVTRLVDESGEVARWGADNEDSKTPIMRNFLLACENLIGCFDKTLRFDDVERGRAYRLENERLSKPIKRFPGLAIPDGNHLYQGSPLPLHLVDFALHMYHNWDKAEALVFYVPKLENEEEARYVRWMIEAAEDMLAARHDSYQKGAVRVFIVYENPRAIFRIQEIAEALHPYFLGGSLGWHDFLASTARIFKNDPRYRIPVKADPNIVINHIKESHRLLVEKLSPLGGIKIGGMYGILFEDNNPASFEVSMVGYIKDVVTQLKRGLDGFWVAHPDFVRTGIALVKAFEQWRAGERETLKTLVRALVPDDLDKEDPLYGRAVLAATLEKSDVIANDDPEEVRYNIFQALQYLADWLSGNGCVALPATMTNQKGEKVTVRVMDDLATTERSRWELWAEVAHGRVSVEMFDRILEEELAFIQSGKDIPGHQIAVRWEGEAARWYPIAAQILRELVVTETPVEFATELLLQYTFDFNR
jgi:malate synthase